mmetsp:Transcript_61905/g.126238  ORF Transcript_61905/g.126238 Transcript_61905/m.126238 type:complete len:253 (-) Transcript_61905:69-827(-)|eukprot:CAMPEP_0201180272 /NCGR_PEP_ID=MMETSP0851-20130426/115683_1 /ASSEMBLY_ACC=CAM_ASM_000631 /TAXON_ID=183588 /ORGANISM="Pseudo-nitzschia fraudulenta, Strain WWA7" /LENGTH=252 /DNA_ID=CAMNT_0047464451 /DNA_START=160 /DNA_END=918 /DNA_ORIENTATION=+
MAGKKKAKSGGSKNKKSGRSEDEPNANVGNGLILVDPSRCRFQHSRIRANFSGCGRSVYETLDGIKEGKTKVSDLPPIQVLVGNSENNNDGPWYFSLNNRRLWVLKRLRDEGYLEKYGNKVAVRVRKPKSKQEKERYTVSNCALEAKVMGEKKKLPGATPIIPQQQQQQHHDDNADDINGEPSTNASDKTSENRKFAIASDTNKSPSLPADTSSDGNDDDEDEDSDTQLVATTRSFFGAMMMDDSSSDDEND